MAIVPSGVSVPAQSKELDNTTVTTAYGIVYRQVVTLADPETAINYMRVGGNGAYVDVRNVVALPLPTGAATETTVAGLLTNTQLRASAVETTKKTSSFSHITTNTTTTVKSGAGVLRRIVINTKGSGANTLTIYNNTSGSGTTIGIIDTVNGVSGHFEYGVSFSTGLTIVTANGTAADVTVIYE